jgi:tetratricopeptide (TPR) repeat protein
MVKTIATLASILLLAASARGDVARDESKRQREQARAQFNSGHFDDALEHYRAAYKLSPDADLFYDIGLCQESLHQSAAAIESYQRFLDLRPNAKDRGDVEVRIAAIKMTMANEAKKPASADHPAAAPVVTAPATPPPATTNPPPANLAAPNTNATPPATDNVLVAAPAPVPIYRRWYFWGAIAAVVVVATIIGVAAGFANRQNHTFDGVVAQ